MQEEDLDMDYYDDDLDWVFEDVSTDESTDDEEIFKIMQRGKRKRGRPSKHEMHPELVSCVKSYIQQSSAAAHLRRRDDVFYTNGVSLKDIVNHVKRELDISISKDTVHRLLKPKRKGTNASKLFKSLIEARVPPKRNSGEKKTHVDFHYTCSQVNLVNEMASLCNETVCISVDNKNKVEVGNPAANRRAQIRSFYLESESPNYNDHDFPYRNSKLTPAGYQVLKVRHQRSRSCSPIKRTKGRLRRSLSLDSDGISDVRKRFKLTKDKLGREKVAWPRSGPLSVELYPSRVIESTNVMHANFLLNFLQQQKLHQEIYNVVAIADGGPDWSVKGIINMMSLGYLWKNLKLDTLIVQCYAPGHSRFNPIERSWSQLTKWLVGVVLPVDLDGEIPKENDHIRWNQVLDRAAQLCSKFWHGKYYGGFPVSVKTFLSDDPLVAPLKSTHSLLHTFTNASLKKIKESTDMIELQKIYQFFVKHCNRKAYQIEFIRCKDEMCQHCSLLPIRNNDFLEMINLFGGSCPSPVESNFNPGHYNTFLEMLRSQRCKQYAGNKLHKVINNCTNNGICPFGCAYAFFSNEDKKRHFRLMGHSLKNITK